MNQARSRIFTVLLFSLFVLLLFAFLLFNGWVHKRIKNAMDKELGEHLISLCTGIRNSLEPEEFFLLGMNDEDVKEKLNFIWEELKEKGYIFDIFVLDDSMKVLYSAREPEIRGKENPFLEMDKKEIILALSGISVYSNVQEIGNDFIKRGYVPVKGQGEEIIGVIGVEADAGFLRIIKETGKILLLMQGFSIMLIFLSGIFVYLIVRNFIRVEKTILRSSALTAMGEMSSLLAHEIKNPLTIIKGTAEILIDKVNSSDRSKLNSILEEVERLREISSKYLSFAPKETINFQKLDISEILRSLISALERKIALQNITILSSFNNIPYIYGDPVLLRQAFLNIFLNAIDALKDKGGEIRVELKKEKENAVISIADSGKGIHKKIKKRIIEPFFTTKEKGSGLGLFVTNKIVKAHKGSLKIVSDEKRGTTVSIFIPVEKNA